MYLTRYLCHGHDESLNEHMDGIMHKWANPYFDDFVILGVFESSHPKLYLTKRAKCLDQSHSVVQAKVCLRMMLFLRFS